MSEPLVVAIMLTRDRPAMARRAVECFRRQTYGNKRLCVVDSGTEILDFRWAKADSYWHIFPPFPPGPVWSIGRLRNRACEMAEGADIIVHVDDDDVSHPNRISEQVALLQSTGKDVVGYRDMVFQDVLAQQAWIYESKNPRYCLETSLCYWRRTWERQQFGDTSSGEGDRFLKGLNSLGVSSMIDPNVAPYALKDCEPRMIATIHGGNTAARIKPHCLEWRRAPQFDKYCQENL